MKIKTLIIVAVAVLGLAGCAVTPPVAEQSVEERAQARWDLLLANDAIGAYEYYTPGYRQMVTRTEYAQDRGRRPIRIREARVKGAECQETDRCTVTTTITYSVPGGPTGINQMRMTRDIEEQWLRLEGQWWYSSN
jgi:hypothetical protein